MISQSTWQSYEPVVVSYANNPGEIAAEKFKMYHIQLPAFRRAYKTLDSVKGDLFLTWLYVFDWGWRSPQEMEVLSGMTEGLKNFAKRYNYAIDDPELIRCYRMIEDGKRDIATRIGVAVRKAEQKTARRVERETAQRVERETAQRVERETAQRVERETTQRVGLENARRMKEDGMDASLISKYTGLSEKQVAEL